MVQKEQKAALTLGKALKAERDRRLAPDRHGRLQIISQKAAGAELGVSGYTFRAWELNLFVPEGFHMAALMDWLGTSERELADLIFYARIQQSLDSGRASLRAARDLKVIVNRRKAELGIK